MNKWQHLKVNETICDNCYEVFTLPVFKCNNPFCEKCTNDILEFCSKTCHRQHEEKRYYIVPWEDMIDWSKIPNEQRPDKYKDKPEND